MTFVLSSETTNAYGVKIRTSGIDLTRMHSNPVMLYGHDHHLPIGRWDNLRKEGGKLLAEAAFDEKDPVALGFKSKVTDGYLKAASIGIDIDSLVEKEGEVWVEKCTLLEASIVPVPANQECLSLHLSATQQNKIKTFLEKNTEKMQDIKNYLNLGTDATEGEILEAIVLKDKLISALEAEKEAQLSAAKQALLQAAVKEKKINAEEAKIFEKLSVEEVQKIVALRTPPPTIMGQLQAQLGKDRSAWSFGDWSKKDPEGLQQLKAEQPDYYNNLFTKTFKGGQ